MVWAETSVLGAFLNNPIERGLAADLATNIARYNRRDFIRGIMLLAMSSGSSGAQGFAG